MEKNSKDGGMRKKEAPINKKVVDWLNSLPQCYAEKRKGGRANPGQLDVTGCLQGIRIELEGKVGDNRPTKIQYSYIKKWGKAGAITGWYTSLREAQELVRILAAQYDIII
jgi:hypothetical protein